VVNFKLNYLHLQEPGQNLHLATQVRVTVVGGGGGGLLHKMLTVGSRGGGIAVAMVPVSAPVAITVGTGGTGGVSGGSGREYIIIWFSSISNWRFGKSSGTNGSPGTGTVTSRNCFKNRKWFKQHFCCFGSILRRN
jgi:hypothetical protein